MRWVLPFVIVCVGCVVSIPSDPTLSADIAAETARMVMQLRRDIPPTPASDECDNCGGKGTLGDGRISVECPACGGTGKKPVSVCKDCPKT